MLRGISNKIFGSCSGIDFKKQTESLYNMIETNEYEIPIQMTHSGDSAYTEADNDNKHDLELSLPFRGGDWGFSIQRGRCREHKRLPMVGRLRPRGNAQKAGIRSGDVLIQVQGHRTADKTVTSIASLIRECESTLVLRVDRCNNCASTGSRKVKGGVLCSTSMSSSWMRRLSVEGSPTSGRMAKRELSSEEHHCNLRHHYEDGSTTERSTDTRIGSAVMKCDTRMRGSPGLSTPVTPRSRPKNTELRAEADGAESNSNDHYTSRMRRLSPKKLKFTSNGYESIVYPSDCMKEENDKSSSIYYNKINSRSEISSNNQLNRSLPDVVDELVLKLFDLEDEFVLAMRAGVEAYGTVLRATHDARNYARIMQNVEKLISLSEYHVIEISTRCTSSGYTSGLTTGDVAEIYSSEINAVHSNYLCYERGLHKALSILRSTNGGEDSASPSGDLLGSEVTTGRHLPTSVSNIVRFLCRPLHHIKTVNACIKEFMAIETSQKVLEQLTIIEKSLSVNKSPSRHQETCTRCPGSGQEFNSSCEQQECQSVVDKLADILEFNDNVKPFPLNDDLRRLIYVGDAKWSHVINPSPPGLPNDLRSSGGREQQGLVDDNTGKTGVSDKRGFPEETDESSRVSVLVFNDMLLLMEEDVAGGRISTVHEPIRPNDISGFDFRKRDNTFEIHTTTCKLDANGFKLRSKRSSQKHIFKVKSTPELHLWKSIISALIINH